MSTAAKVIRGAITALVTPFDDGGRVDAKALAALAAWQVEQGIHGIAPCGTTGEGATLDDDEHGRVIAIVAEAVAGRVPVVAGCGSNDTRRAVEGARRAASAGADALLVVSPYYNKPNRSGMIAHYRAVAEATDLPVMVYNVPGRTGQDLGAELILELAEIDGISSVKEASADLDQIATILAFRPAGFGVFSGDDSLALPTVALGADGVVSVVGNEAPGPMAAMVDAALEGDFARARTLHFRLLPLMRANFAESNPVPVKTALGILGRCREDLRAPLGSPTDDTRRVIRDALTAAGLL
jgi:4-hydroxy-tetrahydrodipicolinate synthase